tara:strand:+ start:1291 stop:1455 length:165 start_codon:yes stop_codon:yes gene_type:complete
MQKTNKNSLLGNLVLNKLVFLIIIMLMLLLAGGDGSSYVCVDAAGVLFTQEGAC